MELGYTCGIFGHFKHDAVKVAENCAEYLTDVNRACGHGSVEVEVESDADGGLGKEHCVAEIVGQERGARAEADVKSGNVDTEIEHARLNVDCHTEIGKRRILVGNSHEFALRSVKGIVSGIIVPIFVSYLIFSSFVSVSEDVFGVISIRLFCGSGK